MREGWLSRTIGEVCELATGGTPSRSRPEFFGGEIKWLVSGDINQREIFDCEGRITEAGMRNSSAKILPINSVMIALNGQGKTRGTVSLLRTPAACNQSMVCITPKPLAGLLPEFLYANLHGRYEEIRRLTSDDDKDRRGLNMGLVRGITIPIAPLPEQQRIVALLDELSASLATTKANVERNIESARSLFDCRLQVLFSRRRDEWKETTLGDAYDVRDGTHDSPRYQDAGYPLVTSRNLKPGGLCFDDARLIGEQDYLKINERSAVHKGDVLFAMIGTIGNPTLVEIEPEFAIKNVALFKNTKGQSGAFLRYFLSSRNVVNMMARDAKGATQKFVGLGYLRAFPICLPPLDDQLRMVEELDELARETQRLTRLYERKLIALEELKKSLLRQAFNGEL
jgi:type I restriction enzyme S subunit